MCGVQEEKQHDFRQAADAAACHKYKENYTEKKEESAYEMDRKEKKEPDCGRRHCAWGDIGGSHRNAVWKNSGYRG